MLIENSHAASSDFNTAADLKVASTFPVRQASKIHKGIYDLDILADHRQVCLSSCGVVHQFAGPVDVQSQPFRLFIHYTQ